MAQVSGPTLDVIVRLRLTTAHVTELADSILVGAMSNQHNALALMPAALATLRDRVDAAVEALEHDTI